MRVDASRLRAVAAQFQRRSLQLTGVIALALIAIGVVAGPTKTMGAVLVSLGTALLSSVVVAAVALEREDFAQSMLDHGLQRLFENRKTAFADSYWTGLVRNVRSHYRVLGTANHGYLFDEQARKDTGESFRDAIVKRRVAVEMLWLRPDSDIARLREAEEGRRTIEDTLESIVFFWEFRESLPDDSRERFALREYDTLPSCGLTWADDQMIVTHYLAGRRNLGSPGLVLGSGMRRFDRFLAALGSGAPTSPPLADVYARNYTEIASDRHSRTITSDRVGELRALQTTSPSHGAPSEADLRDEEEGKETT